MLWLIDTMRGSYLTSKSQTLQALQNTFILIYHCKIYLFYACIYFYLCLFFTIIISLSHIIKAFVPYGYVVILSYVCNFLSSLLLIAILFTFSVYTI